MTSCTPAHRIFSLLFTCAIVAVSCSCAWGAGQEEIARFRREYPPAAKTIEQRFDQVRGKARVRLEQASGEIRRIEDVTFATLGPLRKFESIQRNPGEGVILKTRVVCIGKDSGFTLNQLAGREDYVVESIDEGSDLGRSYTTHFGKLLEAPYSVTRTTFADLLEYPDSNVLSAEPVEREGRSLLEVVIQHGKPEQPLQTRVLFDPAAGWVARQYQVSMMGYTQPNMRVEIEYRGRIGAATLELPVRGTPRRAKRPGRIQPGILWTGAGCLAKHASGDPLDLGVCRPGSGLDRGSGAAPDEVESLTEAEGQIDAKAYKAGLHPDRTPRRDRRALACDGVAASRGPGGARVSAADAMRGQPETDRVGDPCLPRRESVPAARQPGKL